MTSGDTHNSIVVKIPQSAVSVSHMSNLLRVLQATVREISSSQLNELYPAGLPILVANFEASKDQTTIRMSFGDSINRNSNPIVSTTTTHLMYLCLCTLIFLIRMRKVICGEGSL